MFDLLTNLTKAAVGVVTAPVAVVADIVTMGGAINERKNTYTGDQCRSIVEALERAIR